MFHISSKEQLIYALLELQDKTCLDLGWYLDYVEREVDKTGVIKDEKKHENMTIKYTFKEEAPHLILTSHKEEIARVPVEVFTF